MVGIINSMSLLEIVKLIEGKGEQIKQLQDRVRKLEETLRGTEETLIFTSDRATELEQQLKNSVPKSELEKLVEEFEDVEGLEAIALKNALKQFLEPKGDES